MENKSKSEKIVNQLFENDPFVKWLGIELQEVTEKRCIIKMTVRKEMLNGFSIAHGGITYSLADTALAYASNAQGRKSVSLETSISHVKPLVERDTITATTEELSLSNKIGIYQITVKNQNGDVVALFKGTAYRTSKEWFHED